MLGAEVPDPSEGLLSSQTALMPSFERQISFTVQCIVSESEIHLPLPWTAHGCPTTPGRAGQKLALLEGSGVMDIFPPSV